MKSVRLSPGALFTENADGTKAWYRNGRLHRDDGPAVEHANGDKFWFRDGKRHREDGPATEYANGDKAWWRDGRQLTKDKFVADIRRERQRKGEAFASTMNGGLMREIALPRPLQIKPAKGPKR